MKTILKYIISVVTVMMISSVLKAEGEESVGCSQTCKVNAGLDQTICVGKFCTLGGIPPGLPTGPTCAGTPSTYSWSPTAGLSCTTCANPVFTPTSTGVYTFTVTVTIPGSCCCLGATGTCGSVPCSSVVKTDTVIITVYAPGSCLKNGKTDCIEKKEEIIGLEPTPLLQL